MIGFVHSAHLEGFLESPETSAGSRATVPDEVPSMVTSTSCHSDANSAAFLSIKREKRVPFS